MNEQVNEVRSSRFFLLILFFFVFYSLFSSSLLLMSSVVSSSSSHFLLPSPSDVSSSFRSLNSSLVLYSIFACSSCPFFARADRLISLICRHYSLDRSQFSIQLVAPEEWNEAAKQLANSYGFQSSLTSLTSSIDSDSIYRTSRCIVFRPFSGVLVGGEKEFREEILNKFGLECDVEWPLIAAIAEENHKIFKEKRAAEADEEKKRAEKEKSEKLVEKERRHTLKFNRM
jgi:hypothetical protein